MSASLDCVIVFWCDGFYGVIVLWFYGAMVFCVLYEKSLIVLLFCKINFRIPA